MALQEISVLPEGHQTFSVTLSGQKVTLGLRYNVRADRFSLDLFIDEQPRLLGKTIQTGVDVLRAHSFGIGSIFAADPSEQERPATFENLTTGAVKLYHYEAD